MRTAFFATIGLLTAGNAVAAADSSVERAVDALISGKHAAAKQLADDGLASPSVPSAESGKLHAIRGEALFFNSGLSDPGAPLADMTMAVTELSAAIDPAQPPRQVCDAYGDVFVYRGFAQLRLRRYREALQDLQDAAVCEPDSAFVQFGVGEVNFGMEESDKAIAAYDAAIKLRPDYRDAYSRRANNYENLHQADKALADYGEVLRLDPDDANTYNNRATILGMIGRTDDALADIEKSIELNPTSFLAYLNRAQLYYAKGQFTKAREDWDRARGIFEKSKAGLEKAVGPKTMAWFEMGFADLKERLDDAPK